MPSDMHWCRNTQPPRDRQSWDTGLDHGSRFHKPSSRSAHLSSPPSVIHRSWVLYCNDRTMAIGLVSRLSVERNRDRPITRRPNGLEMSRPASQRLVSPEMANPGWPGRLHRVVRRPRNGGHHPNLASDLVDLTLPWMSSSHPALAFTGASNSGTYGLMSRSGVPSRMSRLA